MYLTWLNSTKQGTRQAQGFEESQGERESNSATLSLFPLLHLKLSVKTLRRFSSHCNWDSSQSDSSMVLERAHSTLHALHTEGKCLRSLQ